MEDTMSQRFVSLSPLRSPRLRRQFQIFDYNTHFPVDIGTNLPVKKLLVESDGYFRAEIDVRDFKGEEITVKIIGHTILVECKHLEKEDTFGSVARSFSKKYIIPITFDMSLISSKVSKGVLSIILPPPNKLTETRVVSIEHE